MMPLNAAPRDHLSHVQVEAILRDRATMKRGFGCELVDRSLNVLLDLTSDLRDGSVTRESYATLHGRCVLELARELAWGSAMVRPYVTLASGPLKARFNMGVYFTNTPKNAIGQQPRIYGVEGYDILHGLNDPTGDTFSVAAGENYLQRIEAILVQQGFTKYIIDPARSDATLPNPMVWPLDENTTWLKVINDLISAIGYRGIWSDWNGYLRVEPYAAPKDRPSEWLYEVSQYKSQIKPERTIDHDYFFVPNRWVAVRSNGVDQGQPVEGDGIYTYVNEFQGETSVEARGRTITRILPVEAADQAALIARAQESIDADIRVATHIELTTSPMPIHWHFDRMTCNDPEMGPPFEALSTSWTLPFKGGMMEHRWSVV